jgi:membrane protein
LGFNTESDTGTLLTFEKLGKCAYQALDDTITHDGIEHAGYIAFLAVLSIFPFLVFFFAVMGVFGQTQLGASGVEVMLNNDLIPPAFLAALRPRIEEIISGPPQGLLTFAIIGAIWTASSSVEGLRTVLNRAYRVSTPPAYIWRRLLSIAQFLILTGAMIFVTFLFIVVPNLWETVLSTLEVKEQVNQFLANYVILESVWHWLRYVVAVGVLFILVMVSYVILPNIKQSWRAVLPGAATVVFLWFMAGLMLSAYVSDFQQVNIIYGSLGGFIAALLFFYISAMIFIFGAEFNYAIEKALGHRVIEKEKVRKSKVKKKA